VRASGDFGRLDENSVVRKAFFFEKKKQKTFDRFGCGLFGESEANGSWFFGFSKNNRLVSMRAGHCCAG
jgi:hypothetical protein